MVRLIPISIPIVARQNIATQCLKVTKAVQKTVNCNLNIISKFKDYIIYDTLSYPFKGSTKWSLEFVSVLIILITDFQINWFY